MKTIQGNVKAGRRQHYYDNSNEIRHDKATISIWWRLYGILFRRDAANNCLPRRDAANSFVLTRLDAANNCISRREAANAVDANMCQFFSKQQWNCHTVASLENSRLYIYIYIYTDTRICNVCMYVCLYVCLSVCMSVCLSVCMYVCRYVRMYVRMYVCMHVYVYVCM